MDSVDFLEKLGKYYKIDGSDEDVKERIETFSQILDAKEAKSGRKYDYEEMFKAILVNHSFTDFPLLADIYKHIKYLPVDKKTKALTEEKEFQRRKFVVERFGHKYEFYEVSSDWDDVHTIKDLKEDKENKNFQEIFPS